MRTDAKICGMGHSMKRKEDPRFIRGKGNYVDDIKLPGMLYMDIVRSPYAHARIKKIDTSKAIGGQSRSHRTWSSAKAFIARARKSFENFEAKNRAQSSSENMFPVMQGVHWPSAIMANAPLAISRCSMAR